MKSLIIILCLIFCFNSSFSQKWTEKQIAAANTCQNIKWLTSAEKSTIMYINLARLYPQDFLKNEVLNYKAPDGYIYSKTSTYYRSLVAKLKTRKPVKALGADAALYESAKCFAIESGKNGIVGHNRINCKQDYYAECCSYGWNQGKDIVMQLLIDEGNPGLGHRKICLDNQYSKVGVSIHTHKVYSYCAVIDFK